MASTNIHSIKFTLGKALTYICDPQKTQNGGLVSAVNCHKDYAEMEFCYTRKIMNPNGHPQIFCVIVKSFNQTKACKASVL